MSEAPGTQPMYSNRSDLYDISTMITPSDFLMSNLTFLYYDIGMTSTKSPGFYSDGTSWYEVTGYSGQITNAGLCLLQP